MKKKRVFISGITGTMGQSVLKHCLKHSDSLELVSIVRESEKNKELMADYENKDIDIIWGDMRDYIDIRNALKGVDMIIHLAALVSPKADYFPELAWEVNVGSVDNILKAISELALDEVKLVYIGTVAQTGSRLPPIHWGRVGDPIKSSTFDSYAASKNAAERKIIESGLKYWVSLRQTGILHEGLLSMREGIMFHQPLNNVFEWITDDDSGRLIANLCTFDLEEDFWKKVYNIGGGESCRVNNYDFMSEVLRLTGVKDIKKIFEPKWFATQNFHGQYYLDSDQLNDILDFRRESFDDFLERVKETIKFPNNMLGIVPSIMTRDLIMKKIAMSEQGPLSWIKNKDKNRVNAFWGSFENYKSIKNWTKFKIDSNYDKVQMLYHGYDENKDESLLNQNDMQKAAIYRGGHCLSKDMIQGDLDSPLRWTCNYGHVFMATPRLVLKTGHWCPECEAPPWNYENIAKVNPFFDQVWNKE